MNDKLIQDNDENWHMVHVTHPSRGSVAERTWVCSNSAEAKSLVKFLYPLGVRAYRIDDEIYQRLVQISSEKD